MHRKIDDSLAAVRHPVSKFLAENVPRGSLRSCETNPRLHLFRAAPPRSIPEWAAQDLFSCVATPLQGQIVCFLQAAIEVHDTSENARLVEHGSEYRGGGNVAINLEHGIVAE